MPTSTELSSASESIHSLYFHIPFCEAKCHYCDFYSIGREKTPVGAPDRFITALRVECELRAAGFDFSHIETVFFGGGTPTTIDPEKLAWAIEPLKLNSQAVFEWTCEANPSSVTQEKIAALRLIGVNRISMGVQATENPFLKLLGRVHSESEARRAIDEVFSAGITNLSVDLLCGVPGQTLKNIESSLSVLTSYPINHLSCYLLTLAKHHPMAKDLPNEETQLEHLLFVHQWLASHGFEHYEISNFCKPGFESKHNLNYWKGRGYLGFGPSAHSFFSSTPKRFKNASSHLFYASELIEKNRIPIDFEETLSPTDLELEKWMLSLRLASGFPKAWLNTERRQSLANRFITEKLLESHPNNALNLRPTPRGFALSDQLIRELS